MKRGRPARTEPTDRECAMAAAYKTGKTLEEIGATHGITRERVRQILVRRFGMDAADGGNHERARRRRIVKMAAQDAWSLKERGCSQAQYLDLREMFKPTRAFSMQRKNADARGIAWELTLWQWWSIWQDSGHWDQRGRGNGYMMCRKGDVGPYSIDNVFIERGNVNSSEGSKKSDLPLGVTRAKTPGRFKAMRSVAGRKLHLGTFTAADAAHAAYLAADPFLGVAE